MDGQRHSTANVLHRPSGSGGGRRRVDEDVHRVLAEMKADDAPVGKPFAEVVFRLRHHAQMEGDFDPRGEALILEPATDTVPGDEARVAEAAFTGRHVDVVIPLELAECGGVRDVDRIIHRLYDRVLALVSTAVGRSVASGCGARTQVAP